MGEPVSRLAEHLGEPAVLVRSRCRTGSRNSSRPRSWWCCRSFCGSTARRSRRAWTRRTAIPGSDVVAGLNPPAARPRVGRDGRRRGGLMTTAKKTRVLVLGGGFAGMFAAKELQRRVGAARRGRADQRGQLFRLPAAAAGGGGRGGLDPRRGVAAAPAAAGRAGAAGADLGHRPRAAGRGDLPGPAAALHRGAVRPPGGGARAGGRPVALSGARRPRAADEDAQRRDGAQEPRHRQARACRHHRRWPR